MPRLDRLWYEIDAEVQGFDKGVLQAEQRLKSFTEYAAGHPIAVLGALGVAATLAAVKLAGMAADFEKQMAQINTVLDPTQAKLSDLAKGLQDTFANMPIASMEELSKGLYDIVSSGIDAGKSIEFLNVAARAAVGGVTSVATAVDGLTTAVNAFKGQGLTVQQASDQMFQAVNKGKITFAELSHAMGEGASIAAGTGIKFADLNAAVAQLSLGGMNASMAMVGVRSAIVNILKPSQDFIQTFPELAAEFNRAKLEAVGFTGFLSELTQKAKGNSDVFVKLFGDVQGFNAVMALTATDGGAGLRKMLDDVEHSAGQADIAAEKMGQTTSATNTILKNQLHIELVTLGTEVLPAFNTVLEASIGLLQQLSGAAAKANLRGITEQIADLGVKHGGGGKFNNFLASWMTPEQVDQLRDNVTAFIGSVKRGQIVLSELSTQQLTQLNVALHRVKNSYGELGAAAEPVNNQIAALLAERAKKESEAAAASAQAAKVATQGAVVFTESTAKSVAALATNVTALGRGETAARTYGIAMMKLKQANTEAADAAEAARRAQQTGNKEGAEAAQKASGDALAKATEARREARQALQEMDQARKAAEAEKKRKEMEAKTEAQARRDLAFGLQEAVAKTTGTVVDDLSITLAKQVADFRAKIATTKGLTAEEKATMSAQVDAIERRNVITIELAKNTERVNSLLREADKAVLGLTSNPVDTVKNISSEIDRLTEKLRTTNVDSEEFKSITDDISKLESGRAKVVSYIVGLIEKGASQAEREAAAKERAARAQKQMADSIGAVAKSAVQLAESFGLMNSESAQALGHVIDIAKNLPAAFSGDLTSIASVVTSMAQLVGLSRKPEDPEVVRAREANTKALRDLTDHIGDLAKSNVSGASFVGVQRAISQFMANLSQTMPGREYQVYDSKLAMHDNINKLDAELRKLGSSYSELEAVAKALGVTLTTWGDIRVVLEAMGKADLATYVDTYAGALQRLNDEFALYDITDPGEKLRRTVAFLTSSKGIPAISNALGGLDIDSVEGASTAITKLQSLFEALAAGSVGAADLGGATLDETRQAILDLIAQLRGTSAGSTQSFGYSQQITEVTGSHIAGLLSTANVYALRTATATESIVALLQSALLSTTLPSVSAPRPSSIPGGIGPSFSVQVNVNGNVDPSNAEKVGQAVGREALATINQGLAAQLRQNRRAQGNVIVT